MICVLEKHPFVRGTLVLEVGPYFIQERVVQHKLWGSAAIPIPHGPAYPPMYDIMNEVTYVVFELCEVRGRKPQSTMDGHESR